MSRQQRSWQQDAVGHRGTSWSRPYHKLNYVSMKRASRAASARNNTFSSCILCITHWIMKKRCSEKRKISSERVEELHVPARRNFPRRRDTTICGKLISSRCARIRASTEATITNSPSSMCWVRVDCTAQEQVWKRDGWRYHNKIIRLNGRCPKNLQTDMRK